MLSCLMSVYSMAKFDFSVYSRNSVDFSAGLGCLLVLSNICNARIEC